jgi:hypothetical protein
MKRIISEQGFFRPRDNLITIDRGANLTAAKQAELVRNGLVVEYALSYRADQKDPKEIAFPSMLRSRESMRD